MAEFDDLRKSIHEAVSERERVARAQFVVRNQSQKLQAQIAALSRSNDPQESNQIQALNQQVAELEQEKRGLQEQLARVKDFEASRLKDFSRFSDPRENIQRLDDAHPILLFPLRIETRFKSVLVGERRLNQLWVRVYPDDITVDTFEDLLAEVELKNVKTYWTNIWRAGGIDGEKRAAWQTFVSSHGSGRAHWIIGQYVPLNPNDEPVKVEKEFILVVASENPLPLNERDRVAEYWTAVWTAGTNAADVETAFENLVLALGEDRANEIRDSYPPANINERPTTEVTKVTVAFLDLPSADAFETQQRPWGRPALTRILPDRLVLLGYNGDTKTLDILGEPIPSDLTIGPDPDADESDQIRVEDGELIVPEPLRWMVDFEEALAKGMAFRVNLNVDQAIRGFDQLFVIGINLSSDLENSQTKLESLLRDHQASRKGLSIVRQGTPTNNTEADPSGYTWVEDPDVSYDHFFGSSSAEDPSDWQLKRDGRWLANFIGVDPAVLRDSVNYFAQDQARARAMNLALWPATLGYFMDRMMGSVFADATIEQTRTFFTRFVSGRGPIPAIRVGKQPYGILPVTAFSRMNWLKRRQFDNLTSVTGVSFGLLSQVYATLKRIDEDWTNLARQAAFVGKPGDPHQILLDVVGLHPTSAEFYNRFAQSASQLVNYFRYYGLAAPFVAALFQLIYTQSGINLLASFGFTAETPEDVPEILSKFFLSNADRLAGPSIDDKVLSETEPIRAYRENGDNYIDWLISAAKTSHDTLRRQEGFIDNRAPTALLYLMLRHALDLSFLDVSIKFHVDAGLMTAGVAKTARMDPSFIHVQAAERDTGSPWQYLYKAEPAITQNPSMFIGDFIPSILTLQRPYLQSQIEALELLADAPTAQLERAFAEHIDCCSYRFDSWLLGLVHVQLALMRNFSSGQEETVRNGSHLGVFGWVENLRPENKILEPAVIAPELAPIFQREGEAILQRDPTNGGHILAPSLNHAVTAAVLRNGYISNATPANPDAFAINLTSSRVRLALGVIEGIRNGQTLGALLGYQLERDLHDQESLFLDDIIFDLRIAFPLVANKTGDTQPEEDTAIQSLEARNVVDGLALIRQARQSGIRTYPFGLTTTLPDIPNPTRRNAINDAVDRMFDTNDAVADLAMAESVHQVVQGNYDRAAGTFDAYSKGNFPPLPEVVQTPRSGVTLTHRLGIHFEGGLDPADLANTTPRSKGEPALNRWLGAKLPNLIDIVCQVEFFDQATATTTEEVITAEALALLPIDLLYLVTLDRAPAMAALDDIILHYVVNNFTPRIDSEIRIQYTEPVENRITFFELAPLIRSLRSCLLRSRPLRLSDIRLQGEAQKVDDDAGAINVAKIDEVKAKLEDALDTWNTFLTTVSTALTGADDAAITSNAVGDIDQLINDFMDAAQGLTQFGIPAAGIGSSLAWTRVRFSEVMIKLNELVNRWQEKLVDFQSQLAVYDALDPLTPVETKFARLAVIERVLSTLPMDPPSPTPEQFRLDLDSVVRAAFDGDLAQLTAILENGASLSNVHVDLALLAPNIAAHDAVPFDLTRERQEIKRYTEELKSRAESIIADITDRITRSGDLVTESATKSAAQKIDALTQAIRLLLDTDFAILPEFSINGDLATEFQNSLNDTAALLSYLTTDLQKDFPVDEWLYGVGRAREKMGQFESSVMLIDALSGQDLSLVALQFPYRSPDFWLGLDHPDKLPGTEIPFEITEDKLLYTAHFGAPFNSAAPQCGVLLDEWTEVIPKKEETSGLAFHYDRPNCEPPQTLLLVTPSDFTGEWRWDDVVDALRETLELARKRAVEPAHIDQTAYARFLPAVISSVTTFPIMQSLNFAFNNGIQFREP